MKRNRRDSRSEITEQREPERTGQSKTMKKRSNTMAKTLHIGLATVLLSAGVALAIPAYAASNAGTADQNASASQNTENQNATEIQKPTETHKATVKRTATVKRKSASAKRNESSDQTASGTQSVTNEFAGLNLGKTSTKAAGLKDKKLATVDANERKITAELNKQAMSGQTTPGQQSSLESSSAQQQASAQTDSETTKQ
jgi:hypothetical protein